MSNQSKKIVIIFLTSLLLLFSACFAGAQAPEVGTPENPIIDSAMTYEEAVLLNQPPGVSEGIRARLVVVDVRYYSFDGRVHQGQLVVDKAVAQDVREVFDVILAERFPVASVLPIAHPDILQKGPYGFSPDTDNTSAFAFRKVIGSKKLSAHSKGLAIDLNPRQNPYIKGKKTLPPGSKYDPAAPGTLTVKSPVVRAFKALGWKWGGEWKTLKDYMHFEKKERKSDE